MSAKQKLNPLRPPGLRNHTVFKNLRSNWLATNPLNQAPFLQSKLFHPVDFFQLLELASIDNTSITDACTYYRSHLVRCPSAELVLKSLREVPASQMEIWVNQTLFDQFMELPKTTRRYFKRLGIVIIDFHEDPYYGRVNPHVFVNNVVKRSTNKFYSYLTADLYTPRGLQTIAVRFRTPQDSVSDLFLDLLAQIEAILTPKLMLFDGEFATVRILAVLLHKNICFIERKSITKRLAPLALAYQLTDQWEQLRRVHQVTLLDKTKRHTVSVHVMFHRVQKQMRALVISPDLNLTPQQAETQYGKQFGIETGYHDKHKFQGVTTPVHLSIRLVLFLFAIVLWNLW